MGNQLINIKDIAKLEKDPYPSTYHKILLKNGYSYPMYIKDIPLTRLENYLRMPYSRVVSDKIKVQAAQDNKNCLPIELSEITFVFDVPENQNAPKKLPASVRNDYIRDVIAYHKLLVHRGAFESMITKVIENKEEIYTQEFQNRFNSERDKFLELLMKKTGAFNSKL